MDVLKSIQQENTKKMLRQSTTYLTSEIWHFLQNMVVLKLFLPLDRSSVLKIAASVARASYQPQNAAVLKRSRPRTSDTAGPL